MTEEALLLTNDTLCDPLQLFAERGHSLDRCSFREHWEKHNSSQHEANSTTDKDVSHVQQTSSVSHSIIHFWEETCNQKTYCKADWQCLMVSFTLFLLTEPSLETQTPPVCF